ncbi:MAG: hypothetical protein WDA47_08020 [Bacilli bacterium]
MNKNTVGMLAFGVLLINTIVYILGLFNIGGTILPLVSQILLIIVVLGAAWDYVRKLSQTWKVIYYIIAILVIVSFILGESNIL